MAKSQSALEYLIMVGFVTLTIISILLIAYIYTAILRDRIKYNQISVLGEKILNTAETVYYSGEPSKTSVSVFIPSGVENIDISDTNIIVDFSTSAGMARIAFSSKINITGDISTSEGIKNLVFEAKEDYVSIS